MILNQDIFDNAKHKDLVEIKCDCCFKIFPRIKKNLFKNNTLFSTIHLCSKDCKQRFHNTWSLVECTHCRRSFSKRNTEIKNSKNNFCTHTCSATYTNTHKSTGIKRSKLEIYLEHTLQKRYPTIDFLFNNKEAINSELDIYIPSLRIAFELNGIFHYEPIYGQEKLEQIKNNDTRKFQACLEQNIELCIIDVSHQNVFTKKSSEQFLTIICDIIDIKRSISESN